MRYLLIFLVIYFVFKSIGKLLANFKIENADSDEIKGQDGESHPRLRVDESEIEDADFKDIE